MWLGECTHEKHVNRFQSTGLAPQKLPSVINSASQGRNFS